MTPGVCEVCRKADARQRLQAAHLPEGWDAMSVPLLYDQLSRRRGTPPSTIDAVVWAVLERGVAALKEPANIERLKRCGAAAKTEINKRIASLITAKKIAP
jgi:hypothetical protein